jgi:hypothetical protein
MVLLCRRCVSTASCLTRSCWHAASATIVTRAPHCRMFQLPTLELMSAGVMLAMAACSAVCSFTVTGTEPVPLNCGTGIQQ